MTSIFKSVLLISGALLASVSVIAPADSRSWSKNPISLAQDYMVITDNRGNGDLVIIMWLAAPAMSASPAGAEAKDLLDKYVVLGVVHAHAAKDGTMTFDSADKLEPRDGAGHRLTALNTDTMPPAIVGALAILQSGFARTLGQLGTGIKWFAFDSNNLRACGHGRLLVPFAKETYTYDMPIPGCSHV
jgi:hypothetical protein